MDSKLMKAVMHRTAEELMRELDTRLKSSRSKDVHLIFPVEDRTKLVDDTMKAFIKESLKTRPVMVGRVYAMDEFVRAACNEELTDDDGHGNYGLVIGDEVVEAFEFEASPEDVHAFGFNDEYRELIPFTHVIWVNR